MANIRTMPLIRLHLVTALLLSLVVLVISTPTFDAAGSSPSNACQELGEDPITCEYCGYEHSQPIVCIAYGATVRMTSSSIPLTITV